jgi:uncharacterized protein
VRKTLITALLITNCFATAAYAASFDCTKATTKTEKLICADEKLSALDEQLANAYKTASETVTDKNALKAEQKKWLKQKRNVCTDVACLSQVYQARISALTASNTPAAADVAANSMLAKDTKPAISSEKSITFKLVFGDSYPICKPYVDMLNAAKYVGFSELACERKILPEFPQFKAINWTEITDKKEMEKILEERLKVHYALEKIAYSYTGEFNEIVKSIRKNEAKMYFSKDDVNKDGQEDTVYKMQYHINFNNPNACELADVFYVKDAKIITGNEKQYVMGPYYTFNLSGHNQLFYFEGLMYNSFWGRGGVSSNSNLDIYAVGNKKICGILGK